MEENVSYRIVKVSETWFTLERLFEGEPVITLGHFSSYPDALRFLEGYLKAKEEGEE